MWWHFAPNTNPQNSEGKLLSGFCLCTAHQKAYVHLSEIEQHPLSTATEIPGIHSKWVQHLQQNPILVEWREAQAKYALDGKARVQGFSCHQTSQWAGEQSGSPTSTFEVRWLAGEPPATNPCNKNPKAARFWSFWPCKGFTGCVPRGGGMLASCSWHRHWVACNSNTTSFFAIQIASVGVDLFKFNSIPICHVLGFPKLLNLGSGLKGVLDHIFILLKACWKTKVWSCSGVLFPKPALLPAPSLPLPWPCPAWLLAHPQANKLARHPFCPSPQAPSLWQSQLSGAFSIFCM